MEASQHQLQAAHLPIHSNGQQMQLAPLLVGWLLPPIPLPLLMRSHVQAQLQQP